MTAQGMSLRELMALPVSVTLDDANRALNLGRAKGYAMAKSGTYPVRVLRLGRAYRVPRADLLRVLGIEQPTVSPLRVVPSAPVEQYEQALLRSV